jgi:hypothetical protein
MVKNYLFGFACIFVLCVTVDPICAQNIPEDDPVVASAPLWDADHNGTYLLASESE